MPINIFLSRPSYIDETYECQCSAFEKYLERKKYRICRLGGSDYTLDAPMKAVITLMDNCRGAIIMGYPQYEAKASISKAGKVEEKIIKTFPTPWNQIEATLAFKQQIPVLVVAHTGVSGGVFDNGVTGEYVCTTNLGVRDWFKQSEFQGLFKIWQDRV